MKKRYKSKPTNTDLFKLLTDRIAVLEHKVNILELEKQAGEVQRLLKETPTVPQPCTPYSIWYYWPIHDLRLVKVWI